MRCMLRVERRKAAITEVLTSENTRSKKGTNDCTKSTLEPMISSSEKPGNEPKVMCTMTHDRARSEGVIHELPNDITSTFVNDSEATKNTKTDAIQSANRQDSSLNSSGCEVSLYVSEGSKMNIKGMLSGRSDGTGNCTSIVDPLVIPGNSECSLAYGVNSQVEFTAGYDMEFLAKIFDEDTFVEDKVNSSGKGYEEFPPCEDIEFSCISKIFNDLVRIANELKCANRNLQDCLRLSDSDIKQHLKEYHANKRLFTEFYDGDLDLLDFLGVKDVCSDPETELLALSLDEEKGLRSSKEEDTRKPEEAQSTRNVELSDNATSVCQECSFLSGDIVASSTKPDLGISSLSGAEDSEGQFLIVESSGDTPVRWKS